MYSIKGKDGRFYGEEYEDWLDKKEMTVKELFKEKDDAQYIIDWAVEENKDPDFVVNEAKEIVNNNPKVIEVFVKMKL